MYIEAYKIYGDFRNSLKLMSKTKLFNPQLYGQLK